MKAKQNCKKIQDTDLLLTKKTIICSETMIFTQILMIAELSAFPLPLEIDHDLENVFYLQRQLSLKNFKDLFNEQHTTPLREVVSSLYNYEDYVIDSEKFPGIFHPPFYKKIKVQATTEETKTIKMLKTFEQAVVEIQNDLLENLPKFLRF